MTTTFHGFTIEDIRDLANEYKVLKGKHEMLIKKDDLSKTIINNLNSEIETQKKKVQQLELKSQDDAKELSKKSMEEVEDENAKLKIKTLEQKTKINNLTSHVHRLKSQIEQSDENHKSEVRGLKAEKANLNLKITSSAKEKLDANNKCIELKAQLAEMKKCLVKKTEDNKELQSKVNALVDLFAKLSFDMESLETKLKKQDKYTADVQSLIDELNVENNDLCSRVTAIEQDIMEVNKKSDVDLFEELSFDIESLETKLKMQEKYTCTADVQGLIEELNEASRRIIAEIEIKHGLEKDVIRLDLKNKWEVVLALQKEVHDLKAMNHLLNEAVKSDLKKEAVKSELKMDQPPNFRKDLRPDTEEALKRLAAMKKERRNKDGSSDNTHLTCSPMWGWKGRMA